VVQTVNLKSLPFLDIRFLTDNTVVAAGFDNTPTVFSVTGGSDADPVWSFTDICDKEVKDVKATTTSSAPVKSTGPPTKSAFHNAQALFKASTSHGISINNQGGGGSQSKQPVSKPPVVAFTRHTNTINVLFPNPNDTTKFVTSALDGRVLFWDLNKLGVTVK